VSLSHAPDGAGSPPTSATFVGAADELILSAICTHLDLLDLRAVAQALRPFRQPAANELHDKVMERLARGEPDSTAARKMLLRMMPFDSGTAAKHAPGMLTLLFEHPNPQVRLENAALLQY
jgi:hypothetical protein